MIKNICFSTLLVFSISVMADERELPVCIYYNLEHPMFPSKESRKPDPITAPLKEAGKTLGSLSVNQRTTVLPEIVHIVHLASDCNLKICRTNMFCKYKGKVWAFADVLCETVEDHCPVSATGCVAQRIKLGSNKCVSEEKILNGKARKSRNSEAIQERILQDSKIIFPDLQDGSNGQEEDTVSPSDQ